MSLSGYVTRHRVGLKRSFYTALGITAGAAASLYAQQQLSLPPDDDRVGPPPAVLRAKVLWTRASARQPCVVPPSSCATISGVCCGPSRALNSGGLWQTPESALLVVSPCGMN